MGVGTLIIFIALLLVAAIAASVLIQTSTSLQEKSLTTGTQTKDQISTHIQVLEVSATDGSNGYLTEFNVNVKISAGSEPLKLSQTLVTFNTFNNSITLTYRENGLLVEHNTSGYYTFSNDTGFYTVEYLQEGPNYINGNLQRGDIMRLYMKAPRNIIEDEEIRIKIIPKTGTSTLTEFVTPDVITEQRLYLYPLG